MAGSPTVQYGFHPRKPLGQEVRRVLLEQLALARWNLRSAAEGAIPVKHGVHEARKAFKRMRALGRLIRPALPPERYQWANELLRDCGKRLSGLRDSQVLLELFETLGHEILRLQDRRRLLEVRRRLRRQVATMTEVIGSDGQGRTIDDLLAKAELELAALVPLGLEIDQLAQGLARSYSRARRALFDAQRQGTDEAFHELRKRSKDARYHVELLRSAAPAVLGALEDLYHELTDHLGAHNDLVVLILELRRSLKAARPARRPLIKLLEECRRRKSQLRCQALALGRQLFVEGRRAYARRLQRYWLWAQEWS